MRRDHAAPPMCIRASILLVRCIHINIGPSLRARAD
jgi:hypothetical protein